MDFIREFQRKPYVVDISEKDLLRAPAAAAEGAVMFPRLWTADCEPGAAGTLCRTTESATLRAAERWQETEGRGGESHSGGV